ncbi:hypothetical protein Ancab_003728 [Ancistrocladus abbreviatus]
MMIPKEAVLVFIFTNLIFSSTSGTQNATRCKRTCGSGKSARRVTYPFGFSYGCEIQLNCTMAGETPVILAGGYEVRNFTSDSIMIGFPANCTRPIRDIKDLFTENYAPSWVNALLLQNCSSPMNGCTVPASLIENRFLSVSKGCDSSNNFSSMSCYAPTDARIETLNYDIISQINCKFLFSSIFVDSSSKNADSAISLDFQTLQLRWWLRGKCQCSENANSTYHLLADNSTGCRCLCNNGFTGDGFADGSGCRRACDTSKYVGGRCGGTRIAVLIGGIIAGASAIVLLAVICYFLRRRFSSLKKRMSAKRLLCEAAGSSSVPVYPYKEIERATNGFCEKQRLGTGAYGTVYAGRLYNDDWVAIKKIRNRDNESIEQVMNEIKLLSSVSHPNLVRLLGCCIENGEQILVYEYMPHGTLAQHLQRERGKGLPWTTRLTIATETSEAIAYLHNAMNPPIYHRDIKSSNILLDVNYKSKVADFGLSRFGMTESSHISTAPQGTPGYVDPEYHQNFHLSDKSDVYSFGVVLVEIITALKVVDFSRPHSEVNLAALAVDRIGKGCVDEIIDPLLEPHRDAWTLSSIHKVAELAFRCLAFHRDMRPSMMEVADELEHIKLSAWAPVDENICMASSVASSCSSPFNGSEISFTNGIAVKKGPASRRLIVPQKLADCLASLEEVKDTSPVSVQDPWFSENSSPSTNSLLGHVVQ